MLGNELVGVDVAALEACDAAVAIPTFGVKNSLNVAAAGAVALFEVVRAWGRLVEEGRATETGERERERERGRKQGETDALTRPLD